MTSKAGVYPVECGVQAICKKNQDTVSRPVLGYTNRGQGERMERAAIIVAVLGMCAWSVGQSNDKPASQTAPAGQAAGQAAAAPQGKRPPQAKTQPEFDAYKAAVALTDATA